MSEDTELLRRYAEEHSDAAFAELVRRQVDLVFSAALRLMNGDAHRAQDVAQQVFVECARKAKRLARHPAPVGWFYATTRLIAWRTIRTEQRRNAREQKALAMNELLRESAPEPDWDRLRPILEDAMHELGKADQLAVLLRYFQNRSLQEVGAALGLGENAARMRVDRAVEKLRRILLKRGMATSSTLVALLAANAVQIAPAGLAANFTAAAMAGGGVSTGTLTLLKIMTATQIKIAASVLLVAAATTAFVLQHQTQDRLRNENESLLRAMTQMKTDYEGLSNRLAAAQPRQLSDAQLQELLKLRGETGRLRQQLSASRPAAPKVSGAVPGSAAGDPAAQQQAAVLHRLVGAKTLTAAAMAGFSGSRDGDFPTNWDQSAGRFDEWERRGLNPGDPMPDTTADFNEMTNLFELSYQGSMSNLYNAGNFHDVIVVREKQPWQAPNGGWRRTYGFADGHSEIHASDNGDFSDWEDQHALVPGGGQ